MDWLIRSSKKEKRLEVFAAGEKEKKLIALVADDFVLEKPKQLPLRVEVKNISGKILGFVETFYPEKEEIRILSGREIFISRLEKDKDYLERKKTSWLSGDGKEKFKVIPGSEAAIKESIGAGIKKVYLFKNEKIYYFEKDDEIAIFINGGKKFLEFLPFLLAERIWQQEMVKELLR